MRGRTGTKRMIDNEPLCSAYLICELASTSFLNQIRDLHEHPEFLLPRDAESKSGAHFSPQRVITSFETGSRQRLSCRQCSPPPRQIILACAIRLLAGTQAQYGFLSTVSAWAECHVAPLLLPFFAILCHSCVLVTSQNHSSYLHGLVFIEGFFISLEILRGCYHVSQVMLAQLS